MTKTVNETKKEPWRSGRPSFKAFYPELVLLVVWTVFCIAVAARFGCSKQAAPKLDAAPKAVSSDVPFWTSQTFALEADLNAPTTEPQATVEVAPTTEPQTTVEVAPTTEPQTTDDGAQTTEAVADDAANATKASEANSKGCNLWVWGFFLCLAAAAWIWRACVWLIRIYGVMYEIRTDVNNPKATTILIHRGLLNKKTDSMHIAQVKDLQMTQSFCQKYFQGGVGTIRLFTKDLTDGIVVMKNMEEPARVFQELNKLHRCYWALGGFGSSGLGVQPGSGAEMEVVEGMEDVAAM